MSERESHQSNKNLSHKFDMSEQSDYIQQMMVKVRSVKDQLNESENYFSLRNKEDSEHKLPAQVFKDTFDRVDQPVEEASIYDLISQLQNKLKERLKSSQNAPFHETWADNPEKQPRSNFNDNAAPNVDRASITILRNINFLETLRDELCEQNFIHPSKKEKFETFNQHHTEKLHTNNKIDEEAFSNHLISQPLLSSIKNKQSSKPELSSLQQSLNKIKGEFSLDQYSPISIRNRTETGIGINEKINKPDDIIIEAKKLENNLQLKLESALQRNLQLENALKELKLQNESLTEASKAKNRKISELQRQLESLKALKPREVDRSKSPNCFDKIKSQHNFGQYSYIHKSNYQK